ncbi:MAG: aldehyde ferredoxin oxidoreductase family protein [Chloroflexota bacterium]|nr:aldehyde ferredoxin oxidoreductase family protein [Chloroflexota bacterium]
MNAYVGKLLIVDLSSGTFTTESLNEHYAEQYIGGAGLAARYIYDAIDARTDPLGPDNPLIFMTGPLDATAAPSAGRFVVVARSPQTGLYGEANAGDFFGPDLKLAGYDGIIVRGKSPTPVYLLVRDGKVELRDAAHLRGKTTYDTGDSIRAELNDHKLTVAAIGPAGENLVKYALILASNPRPGAKKGIAGRCGMGAVMGSKNLKAIAVRAHAHRPHIPLHDPEAFKAAVHSAMQMLPDDMSTQIWRAVGTSGGMDLFGLQGNVPTKYWTQGTFDYEKISGNVLAETTLTGHGTCHACMVACGRKVAHAAGHDLPHSEGPEYETLAAFGPLMLVDDLDIATYTGSQCDALGIDSISAGAMIAFAVFLRQQGIVPASAFDGFDLRWGDPQQALQLIELIARRQGIGDAFAEGTKAFAARYGVEGLAVQVNGMDIAMHDPRAQSGMALVYATSPIGGSHNQSDYYMVDLAGRALEDLGIPAIDRFETEGKAANVARHQDWRAVGASLVQCIFPNPPVKDTVAMIAAATGYDITLDNVLSYGERMWDLKRALNSKLGYNARANEKLPELLLRALADGGTEGHVVELEPMLREYYAHREWDWETGKPRRGKLLALGMPEIAQDLWG